MKYEEKLYAQYEKAYQTALKTAGGVAKFSKLSQIEFEAELQDQIKLKKEQMQRILEENPNGRSSDEYIRLRKKSSQTLSVEMAREDVTGTTVKQRKAITSFLREANPAEYGELKDYEIEAAMRKDIRVYDTVRAQIKKFAKEWRENRDFGNVYGEKGGYELQKAIRDAFFSYEYVRD